jgi:hypothetical protein
VASAGLLVVLQEMNVVKTTATAAVVRTCIVVIIIVARRVSRFPTTVQQKQKTGYRAPGDDKQLHEHMREVLSSLMGQSVLL